MVACISPNERRTGAYPNHKVDSTDEVAARNELNKVCRFPCSIAVDVLFEKPPANLVDKPTLVSCSMDCELRNSADF